MISNIRLPSERIGSWLTRIDIFNEGNQLFDAILSPSKATNIHYYCKKRSFITWHKRFRRLNLLYWVAKDYLNVALKLSKKAKKLSVVIMDDPHLLEAFALKKDNFDCPIEIIYSFHGFQLSIKEEIINKIDKVLFLSQSGYKATREALFAFVPEVHIVGNCVDSTRFYPLDDIEKRKLRKDLGYTDEQTILIWMANDRPSKGLHLFEKIATVLLEKYADIKIVVLGSNNEIIHPNINNVGRVSNDEVAKYLQLGDFYMFTSLCSEGFGLSMIEALKTGNVVIASNNGAVEEVMEGRKNVYLVENPNILDNWVTVFEQALNDESTKITKEEAHVIWNYETWEKRFLHALGT